MNDELKQCPFCGSHDLSIATAPGSSFFVRCNNCESRSAYWKKKSFAVDAWNRRAYE